MLRISFIALLSAAPDALNSCDTSLKPLFYMPISLTGHLLFHLSFTRAVASSTCLSSFPFIGNVSYIFDKEHLCGLRAHGQSWGHPWLEVRNLPMWTFPPLTLSLLSAPGGKTCPMTNRWDGEYQSMSC